MPLIVFAITGCSLSLEKRFQDCCLCLVHSAYSSPSHLFIGNEVIQSSEGVLQGDPLGPLLFCLTIHSIVSQLRSELWIFNMDDGTLGGSLDDVVDNLHTVRKAAEDLGLH